MPFFPIFDQMVWRSRDFPEMRFDVDMVTLLKNRFYNFETVLENNYYQRYELHKSQGPGMENEEGLLRISNHKLGAKMHWKTYF